MFRDKKFKKVDIKKTKKTSGKKGVKLEIKEKKQTSILVEKLSNRTFFIVIFLEAVILCLIGYFFFISGAKKELDSVKQDLLPARQQKFKKENSKLAEMLDIYNLYKKIPDSKKEKSKDVLPSKASLPDLLVNLDDLMQANNFSLDGVSFMVTDEEGKKIVDKVKLKEITDIANLEKDLSEEDTGEEKIEKYLRIIEIELEISGGGYLSFENLISQIETNLRLMDIVSFNFSPESDGYSITLKTYYLE